MASINYRIKYGRKKKTKKINAPLFKAKGKPPKPHLKAYVKEIVILSPKKPNSANRKVAIVKANLYGRSITFKAYVPGESNPLSANSWVLIEGKGPKDVPGVFYTVKGNIK